MLEQITQIFDNRKQMMGRLRKASYEVNMQDFRKQHGHYFDEMTAYVGQSEDPETAAREIAENFTGQVKNAFAKNGKVRGAIQGELNAFMVYYVFPSILMTKHEHADLICKTICAVWLETFPGNKIGYADYDTIYGAFREKIFGVF